MSRRRGRRLVTGICAGVVGLVPSCSAGESDADEPARASVPAEFTATFEVQAPFELVAGDGQAWILVQVEGGASLISVDHTGRSTVVARLPGQTHNMARFRDGVAVVRVACDGDECQETATKLLVVDGGGSTVAETEFAREPGSPERSDGAAVLGTDGNVVWIRTWEGPIGYDADTGDTRTGPPDTASSAWSAIPGFDDLSDYRESGDPAVGPYPVAGGQGGQVFVLESDGVIRRYVEGSDVGTLDVPADIFQRYGTLLFDQSSATDAGCFWQSTTYPPTAQCLIRSS